MPARLCSIVKLRGKIDDGGKRQMLSHQTTNANYAAPLISEPVSIHGPSRIRARCLLPVHGARGATIAAFNQLSAGRAFRNTRCATAQLQRQSQTEATTSRSGPHGRRHATRGAPATCYSTLHRSRRCRRHRSQRADGRTRRPPAALLRKLD